MSTILKFPLERVQHRLHTKPNLSLNADILIFEGVRYEKENKSRKLIKPKKNKLIKTNTTP